MNRFLPHCPLRQEDHYWLDTCSGSTSLHYYAAVDTGLTKRNLSCICLSGRAESGAAMLQGAEVERFSSKLVVAHQPPSTLHPPPPPLVCWPQVHSFLCPRTSKTPLQSERWSIVSFTQTRASFIWNSSLLFSVLLISCHSQIFRFFFLQ